MPSDAESRPCPETVETSKLEDVLACGYFLSGKGVPAQGKPVRVAKAAAGGRLLGFDLLLGSLSQGVEYRGRVSASALRPVPVVQVELSSRPRPPPPGAEEEPADGP